MDVTAGVSVALWAVLPACVAAAAQWADGDLRVEWMRLLVLAFAMYAVFTAYPIVVGRRAPRRTGSRIWRRCSPA